MLLPELQLTKTRIAPTPSGYLHLGNILSFVLTAGLAAHYDARIVLRIDDLDRTRANPLYLQDIFDTLHFLELPWHEGPGNMEEHENKYSQLHRLDLYHAALTTLMEQDQLFACNCSRSAVARNNPAHVYDGACIKKQLPMNSRDACLRLHTAQAGIITIPTLSGSLQSPLPADMQHAVLRKKDGYPAYQLASVVDDLYFGIDLVVRGQDLWPSTLVQLYLSQLLSADAFLKTTFYHHTLLPDRSGLKLSKSAGATSIQYLRKSGKKPADIYTMIAAELSLPVTVRNWQELFAELAGSKRGI
jgi:glutamyl/glutaminyl-tRNA synthetase